MIDFDDGEQLLNIIGIILVVFIIFSVAVLVLAAMSAQERSADIPDTDWELQQLNESYVRITHTGGDPVQTDTLSVTVDGTPRHPQWTSMTLSEGEYGVIRVGDGVTVTLLWQHSESERDVLQRWQLSRPTTQ